MMLAHGSVKVSLKSKMCFYFISLVKIISVLYFQKSLDKIICIELVRYSFADEGLEFYQTFYNASQNNAMFVLSQK